jgi:hypothetical protein
MTTKTILLPNRIDNREVNKREDMRWLTYSKGNEQNTKNGVQLVPFTISYDEKEHDEYSKWLVNKPFTHAIHVHTMTDIDVYSFRYTLKLFTNLMMKEARSSALQFYWVIEFGKENGRIHAHGLVSTTLANERIKEIWKGIQAPLWSLHAIEVMFIKALEDAYQHVKYICKSDILYRKVDDENISQYWEHLVYMNMTSRKFK